MDRRPTRFPGGRFGVRQPVTRMPDPPRETQVAVVVVARALTFGMPAI